MSASKKYILLPVLLMVIAAGVWSSVYFEPLDTRKDKERIESFNPREMVDYFWKHKLDEVLETAIDLSLFDSLLKASPAILMEQHGKSVGVTSRRSFLVKGFARSVGSGVENIPATLPGGFVRYSLLMKNVFGNAARNATDFFHVDDFENTMDFNAVATELNSLILQEVIAHKLDSIPHGVSLRFFGAVEVNSEEIQAEMEIVPLRLEITP
jgi:hypothetical protein